MHRPPLPPHAHADWREGALYTERQMHAYYDSRPLDCRTCKHYVTRNDAGCGSIAVCTDGDRYDPLPRVQLWRNTK